MAEETKGLTLNQETMDVLVANIIPTTKYGVVTLFRT